MSEPTRPVVGLRLSAFNWHMREARKRAGFTQAQLGMIVGLHTQVVGLIETLRQRPTRTQAQEIADALDAPLEQLFPTEILDLYGSAPSTIETTIPATHLRALQLGTAPTPLAQLAPGILETELEEVLKSITDRERAVVRKRFGLADGRSHTLDELAKEHHTQRERIRQIEAVALRKLRHPARTKYIKPAMNLLLDDSRHGQGHLVTYDELLAVFLAGWGNPPLTDKQRAEAEDAATMVWLRYCQVAPATIQSLATRLGVTTARFIEQELRVLRFLGEHTRELMLADAVLPEDLQKGIETARRYQRPAIIRAGGVV